MSVTQAFVANPFAPQRRLTREVRVGDVGIGGSHPVRVQSMTTTDTRDTKATADQAERMVAAGCEIVRVTAPSLTDAENLAAIRSELDRRGVRVPLVADIHFTPNAALVAAEHVEKIRINPGNFADKKKFAILEYTDAQYAEEIERVGERFRPLVLRCKELGRAIRIGTNHGSLSDRIMNRFGDTPLGMVESALEFLGYCEAEGFTDIVFSMKASNTQVAIQAYRLLAARLEERAPGKPSYPFHVGVTEAGDGEDGRIKSAIGIGALLADGIGDTVRVSLTEEPEEEIPVAACLAEICAQTWGAAEETQDPGAPFTPDPYRHHRRATRTLRAATVTEALSEDSDAACTGAFSGRFEIGGDQPIRVELDLGDVPSDPKRAAGDLARAFGALTRVQCEGLAVEIVDTPDEETLDTFARALSEAGLDVPLAVRCVPETVTEWPPCAARAVISSGALVHEAEIENEARLAAKAGVPVEWNLRGRAAEMPEQLDRVLEASARVGLDDILVSVDTELPIHAIRLVAARLRARGTADVPLVLRHQRRPSESDDESLLRASIALGAPLCDGIGDVISLGGFADPARTLDLAYRILQGARRRTTRTEFISCPSCGRTLFDLVETTERIKARTDHLVGVKIAIMGCIVNGPGEMADADFGYVGSGPGKINLFVGKDIVARNVSDDVAADRLIELIREHGRWVDPA